MLAALKSIGKESIEEKKMIPQTIQTLIAETERSTLAIYSVFCKEINVTCPPTETMIWLIRLFTISAFVFNVVFVVCIIFFLCHQKMEPLNSPSVEIKEEDNLS